MNHLLKGYKYILKKHDSGYFNVLVNGKMIMDEPMTKSLTSSSQTPNCQAETTSLERQNLICELEKASCTKQLLEHIPVLIEAKEALEKQKLINAVLANILVELITGW